MASADHCGTNDTSFCYDPSPTSPSVLSSYNVLDETIEGLFEVCVGCRERRELLAALVDFLHARTRPSLHRPLDERVHLG